jgi:hypothetical protein
MNGEGNCLLPAILKTDTGYAAAKLFVHPISSRNDRKIKRSSTMKMKNIFIMNASPILLLLAACTALAPTRLPIQPTPTPTVLPATGMQYHFVTNKLLMPTTQEQSQAFALNIDGDAQQNPDNLFGKLFTLLTSAAPGLDVQSSLDQIVNSGQLVSLHAVKVDDLLNDPTASWSLFQGEKTQSAPAFDGTDSFILDSTMPVNAPIIGSLTNGRFSGGPGSARVQMFFLGQLMDVDLIGVRLEADFSQNGCVNGKLGGGVTVEEFHGKLLPALIEGLNQVIKADPDKAATLLQILDSDRNGTIVTQELEDNPVFMLAASPDLDLLDQTGKFSPGQDGVRDSYSVGLGFSCVPATFVVPAD